MLWKIILCKCFVGCLLFDLICVSQPQRKRERSDNAEIPTKCTIHFIRLPKLHSFDLYVFNTDKVQLNIFGSCLSLAMGWDGSAATAGANKWNSSVCSSTFLPILLLFFLIFNLIFDPHFCFLCFFFHSHLANINALLP